MNPLLSAAAEAVRAAGAIQRARFGTDVGVRHKGAVDLVTEVDLASERAIREVLGRLTPDAEVLGEEEGRAGEGGSKRLWIVDPLDGTTNFAHRVPVFCVSAALEAEGRIVVGAIYDPMRDELFLAEENGPATLNGAPISVTSTGRVGDSLLASGFAYDRTAPRQNYAAFEALTRASHGVRRLGAAALDLAYVAAGRFDGFWELGLKPWDTAAGMLLVRRAGGKVTDFQGAPYSPWTPDVIASNGRLHEELRAKINAFVPEG
jgi:myo-inositol-1(or 4)-monophosphatase